MTIAPIGGAVSGDRLLRADGKAVLAGDSSGQDGHALVRLQTVIDPDSTAICAAAATSQLQWKQGPDPARHELASRWTNGDETLPGDLAGVFPTRPTAAT